METMENYTDIHPGSPYTFTVYKKSQPYSETDCTVYKEMGTVECNGTILCYAWTNKYTFWIIQHNFFYVINIELNMVIKHALYCYVFCIVSFTLSHVWFICWQNVQELYCVSVLIGSGDIQYFLNVSRSHTTAMSKYCESKGWYILFLCAMELHFYPKNN